MEQDISTFFDAQPDLAIQQEKMQQLIKRRKLKRQVAAFEERKLLMNQGRYVSQKDKPEHNDK